MAQITDIDADAADWTTIDLAERLGPVRLLWRQHDRDPGRSRRLFGPAQPGHLRKVSWSNTRW